MSNSKGYIILESGQVFEGQRFGAERDVAGELALDNGTVGFIETLTSEKYRGKIVMQTFPLVGGFGWIPEDALGADITPSGYIVREICETPSNFRTTNSLAEEFKKRGAVGIQGVDTRRIAEIIRDFGKMRAIITSNPDAKV